MNLQELYINQGNLKMNEVMKVLAVVMALFAPLTLITGIYGMNFSNMPELQTNDGYFITSGILFFYISGMILFFGKKVGFSIFMSLYLTDYLILNYDKLVKDHYSYHPYNWSDAVFPPSGKFYYRRCA